MPYMIRSDWVDCAFSSGKVAIGGKSIDFDAHSLGEVSLPSGRVAASDPFILPAPAPYSMLVSPGRFPVEVAVAHLDGPDERIAFARVVFAPEPVDHWAMAISPGQNPDSLPDDEVFGYGVDAGTGCFMSPEAGERLRARMDREREYFQVIIDAKEKTYRDTWSWLDFRPDLSSSDNIIAFSSGYGDGVYASYFGLAADERPLSLVTDFAILAEPDPDVVQAPSPLAESSALPTKQSAWHRLAGLLKRSGAR